MEDSIRANIRRSGYNSRKPAIVKSLRKWVNRSVTMENVPEEFRKLHDGSPFLQLDEPGFHIYYSTGTIQMARENGLYGTVADGSHSLQPKTLGRYAQLYCVHGVCNQDLDVPLMFCIMEKKTRRGYKRVFEHLKRSLLGMVFLPQDLWPEVRALRGPPVPSGDLHDRCQDFLNYLETTWLSGPFKDLWCKWRVEELRTTNLAEAFHRRIQVLASVDHPPLSVLIDVLRKLNYEAMAALTRLKE
ncbi:hypothetical protein COOONC_26288, partial [Cooperia oncophora]